MSGALTLPKWSSVSLVAAALLGVAAIWGCSSSPQSKSGGEVPLSAMGDASAHTSTQIAAIQRTWQAVADGELTHEAARESLKRVAWARSRWEGVRRAAIEALLEDEAYIDDTRNMLRLMLPTETQWPILEFICTTAADRDWRELTAAIVRSWSRPVADPPDSERPERFALQKLYPDMPVEDVVFRVFVGEGVIESEFRERDRRDSWTLLQRIDPRGQRTLVLLTSTDEPTGDSWVSALRVCARQLHCIPQTGEELLWLNELRETENAEFWSAASSAIEGLTADQRVGLQLRHVAAVLWVSQHRPQWLSLTRDELLEKASAEQKSRRKHVRAADRTGGMPISELLSGWRDTLVWGDVLSVMIGFELANAPGVSETLFMQVEQDRRDTSTEHGGVINAAADGFALRGYAPRASQRYGDRQFVAPAEMITENPEAIFHYHFHVQRTRNSDYAGPSAEDIQYAFKFGRSCIVFTSITEDILGADLYHGSGWVIDLGEITRPAASQ